MKRTCICLPLLILFVIGCGGSPTEIGSNSDFVCGEDGVTYAMRDADGKDIQHRGSCDKPLECNGPSDCFVNDACIVLDGVGSNVTTVCVPGPISCACPAIYDPVCGEDGATYGSECEAHCGGVMVDHRGTCEEPPGGACVRGGCSGQICVDEGLDVATTCEWQPVYECYQQATCERQKNGQCGFTPTHELVDCLEGHGQGMCRIDPQWQFGFEADCFAPGLMIDARVQGHPEGPIALGVPVVVRLSVIEPPIGEFVGEATFACNGNDVVVRGEVGGIQAECTNLRPIDSHGCSSDRDCGPDERCEFLTPVLLSEGPETIPSRFGVCVPRDDTCFSDEECRDGEFCAHVPRPYPADGTGGAAGSAGGIGGPHGGGSAGAAPLPPPLGICTDLCILIDCALGYFCEMGQCRPADCPDIYAPVCGTDGETYGNGCQANRAGVMVAYEGECRDRECQSNRECPGNTICYPPTNTCQPACAIDCFRYDPVCGTDGRTYGCGEQDAWCNGVRVAHPGECNDPCALIDCAPGYACEQGQCLPIDPCPAGFVQTPQGSCERVCYGNEQCGDEEYCNAPDVCLQDPSCPLCAVCVGWCTGGCEPGFTNNGAGCEPDDCRRGGCDGDGYTCVECGTPTGSEWTCLGPNEGLCAPPDDCRTEGCSEGDYCTFCWTEFACIPEGAVC